ncbi:hypothetical protein [Marilutibacter spongiae]|uniref:Uncharacterized protein n=1 Tax=Marilutibacter spongiae TaxID=2025720 RepID=A0A7W3Y589_9GAMM|nr:hypothetical protein [Lysobacter spongiae]MBB1059957.1 hypothetical protein [Lysobacter spongiae]
MTMRRLTITARLGFATLLAMSCYVAFAAHDARAQSRTFPVDDSASQVLDPNVTLEWDSIAPTRGPQANAVSGRFAVIVRLDVAAWQGRMGRIYMLLPPAPSGPITATWSSRGPLLPGTVRSGERSLVYAGPINGPLIEDTLRIVLQADGRHVTRSQPLEFSFEIDLGAP